MLNGQWIFRRHSCYVWEKFKLILLYIFPHDWATFLCKVVLNTFFLYTVSIFIMLQLLIDKNITVFLHLKCEDLVYYNLYYLNFDTIFKLPHLVALGHKYCSVNVTFSLIRKCILISINKRHSIVIVLVTYYILIFLSVTIWCYGLTLVMRWSIQY